MPQTVLSRTILINKSNTAPYKEKKHPFLFSGELPAIRHLPGKLAGSGLENFTGSDPPTFPREEAMK